MEEILRGPGSVSREGKTASPFRLDVALIHYPVCNKNREIIGAAVTNLDLHDIARAGRTFGVSTLYIVTPDQGQQQLVNELIDHWLQGAGARYNNLRTQALSMVRVCSDLQQARAASAAKWGQEPLVLATCARELGEGKQYPYAAVRGKLATGDGVLLLFGTAWGLAPEVIASADGMLPPIGGFGKYNHLSVRSAAAIVLDRLLGNREN